ncbi:UDP-N-acetylglucosamine 2-epimerase (non-hydrolyzing) [Maribacter algarum]|uniref:UDP-N-acetylglucosamine 2-epimerase (Non-hydrolyzing) n=1 Tax=Maribacter algarum (ex Zhang et al. 2020) TaxID=2578118 RepID=A0A5S3PVL1_9FLAO|nr:UDP-N-acetylglucosamine 2-epimerase (non-hydrolyzing) [Maribacter algarum]TMM58948.1 UDP-N-acetylglucosamine 2-epimerase (non-hydrolyzing) [Maribacter algarum]
MKIITVLGARPQFVKAATVSRALKASNSNLEEKILHTGQHYDVNMSDVFFEEMGIPKPDFRLDVNNKGHGAMTGQMLKEIEEILIAEKPSIVLVYGDTNSTLAGALAAKKLHIPIAHVEAGLRSFNIKMPEEINRILTDRISDLLFCPTENAVENLKKEGFDTIDCEVLNVGDVMYDGALHYAKSIKERAIENDYVLSTIHRAENTDDVSRLTGIISALNKINEDISVVVPLHPRTRKIIDNLDLQVNFKILEPVGYLKMVNLIKYANLVITDSGGLQKEAFFFGKYCVTTRDETEWVEMVEYNFNILAGADEDKILESYNILIKKPFVKTIEPYGKGNSAHLIAKKIESFLSK